MNRQAREQVYAYYSAGQILLRVTQRLGIGIGAVALALGALDYVRVNSFAYASRLSPLREAKVERVVMTPAPERARMAVSSVTPAVLTPRAEIKIAALAPVSAPTIPSTDVEMVSPPVTAALLNHSSFAMVRPDTPPEVNPPPLSIMLPDTLPVNNSPPAPIALPANDSPLLSMSSSIPLPEPVLQPAVWSGPVPLPRPAPGVPPPSPAELLGLNGKDYAKAERCLANAVYFESRSEPVRG